MNPELEKAIAAIRSQGGTEADVAAYLRSKGAVPVDEGREFMADLNAASARSQRKTAREEANAAERQLTPAQRAGQALQNAYSAFSFGTIPMAADALDAAFSDRTFEANRQARRMTTEAMPMGEQVASSILGAVANPLGAVVRAPQGAGLLARAGARLGDAALQGGTEGAMTNLDELSAAGLRQAGRGFGYGMAAGMAGGGGTRVGVGAGRNVNTMRRAFTATPLDKVAFEMRDAMQKADDALYGAVALEAGATGTTPAIRDVLETKTVKPFADIIRRSETFENANDATVLTEAYKLMSEAQRRAANAMEGTPEHLAGVAVKRQDIGLAKGRMMTAATEPGQVVIPGRAQTVAAPTTAQSPNPTVREAIEAHRTRLGQTVTRREGTAMQQTAREALERHERENVVSPSLTGAPSPMRAVVRESQTLPIDAGLPSFPAAVRQHAVAAGENDAFLQTADAVNRVLRGNPIKGKKLTTESAEALRRSIEEMTPAQARRALQATLGRGREVARLTANPVGKFGLVSSFARSIHAPFQIDEFVQQLQKRAGITPSLLDNPRNLDYLLGGTSRATGLLSGDLFGREP